MPRQYATALFAALPRPWQRMRCSRAKRIAAAEPDSRLRSDYGALAVIFVERTRWSAPWQQALKGWNMKESPQVLQWQEEARRD
jgi:hypothetical protein